MRRVELSNVSRRLQLVTVKHILVGTDYPGAGWSIQQTIEGLLNRASAPAELRLLERGQRARAVPAVQVRAPAVEPGPVPAA